MGKQWSSNSIYSCKASRQIDWGGGEGWGEKDHIDPKVGHLGCSATMFATFVG